MRRIRKFHIYYEVTSSEGETRCKGNCFVRLGVFNYKKVANSIETVIGFELNKGDGILIKSVFEIK